MNWAQFKDPVTHLCLTGTVVSYTKALLMTNILGKTPSCVIQGWFQNSPSMYKVVLEIIPNSPMR